MHKEAQQSLKNKAVFLDRDGVINRERGDYTYLLEDFVLNDIADALAEMQLRGYLLIVISNQSGIAKGIYTCDQVNYLHLHLERVLKNRGVLLTEFYYCPHHPDFSKCLCRKPDSLLLEKAIARFNIDPSVSYFIGDAKRDEAAGKKAGVMTILIEPNSSLSKVLPLIK
jgi:D-glycero-D-manno-heptose 1,7-bisphosphate phosphatase